MTNKPKKIEPTFQEKVDTFIKDTKGMTTTRFGRLAMNDPNFVWRMRSGARQWPETQHKCLEFMAGFNAEKGGDRMLSQLAASFAGFRQRASGTSASSQAVAADDARLTSALQEAIGAALFQSILAEENGRPEDAAEHDRRARSYAELLREIKEATE